MAEDGRERREEGRASRHGKIKSSVRETGGGGAGGGAWGLGCEGSGRMDLEKRIEKGARARAQASGGERKIEH